MTGQAQASGRRTLVVALSVAAHAALLAALLAARVDAPRPPAEPEVIPVFLTSPQPPPPPKPAVAPKPPSPARPTPPKLAVRPPRPAPPEARPLVAAVSRTPTQGKELSEAEAAGAATAGSGGGGGGCDLVRALQAAVAQAHRGRALMVWDGDWVQTGGEEGKGLAAVREAIIWEVGFSPTACRTQQMRGLVLISLDDAPGSARLALGSASWRWADLLGGR